MGVHRGSRQWDRRNRRSGTACIGLFQGPERRYLRI